MRIKTILKEDEIQLTLTNSELVWLQVLLRSILLGDPIEGWVSETEEFLKILKEIKPEGLRARPTTEVFENTDLKFIKE